MPRYDAQRIEPKWQQFWEREQTFRVEPDTAKSKLYVLDMFPYPSAAGLHVGHPEGYTATDITSRYQRMRGKAVLHPMGWDAFGLPAEEHAVKTGKHPRLTTEENINNFRRQLKMLGFSYDWSRELSTTDPDYYCWTQWIFLQLFDAWYDAEHVWTGPDGVTRTGKGRPIAELPIPEDVKKQGTNAVRRYQDKHRLAYQHEAAVNWCPGLGTVLANEEVIDGKSERGGHPVERRPLRQWMLRITSYADRLSEELESLNWPESIKVLQRNWIGRSEGAEVDFRIVGAGEATFGEWKTTRKESGFPKEAPADVIRVYTTRPDTLFGATYMVLAPEHPLVPTLTTDKQKAAVEAYQKQASLKSDLDRTDLAKEKTGVFTGGYALNPVNGEPVPVWIADYVLSSYGTGAIMAVPAHDERDFEFATQFKIPVVPVVRSSDGSEVEGKPFTGEGVAINSGSYDGTPTRELKSRIAADLAAAGLGKTAVNYRLRDWLFSRQRYWGEPFPIWHELDEDGQPTGLLRTDAEADLPVTLPEMADFKPTGTPEPLLSKAPESWLYKTSGDGVRLKRETNSMPQWAGSCWYYLRFCSPKYGQRFIDPAAEKYWLPVDLYIGGAEHAVLHLLYSRFWHKVLFDLGHVTHPEPFGRLVNQGMILGEMEFHAYRDPATSAWVTLADAKKRMDAQDDSLVPVKLTVEQVEKKGDQFVLSADPSIVIDARSFKMSKSRQNVVNPDDVVKAYGADSLRLYEMFMGPLEATKPWSTTGVEGVYRFLGRVWRMVIDERDENVRLAAQVQDVPPTHDQLRLLHKTIQSVTDDVEKLSYNTAISRMMEFVNEMTSAEVRPKSVIETFVLLLNPFAPHLAEELWEALGRTESLSYAPWPAVNAEYLVESEVEIPVQFNGKLKGKVKVPAGSDAQTQQTLAAAAPDIAAQLEGKTIVKTVSVPGKMVNFVVR